MRKSASVFPIVLMTLAASICFSSAVRAAGNLDLFVGQKELDRDFGNGSQIEEQDAVALFWDWGRETWPLHIAVDLLAGNRDVDDTNLNVHLDGSTGEVGLGLRWYPAKQSRWRPHLGGGLGFVSGEVKTSNPSPSNDISFDDSKLGYWADAGLAYRVGDHFKLGGRMRYSKAKLDNPGGQVEEVDAGGLAYGATAGWTW